ncbi:hypothetical protein Agabi119p4_11351 [Agaricus bisporus var. burnettii]|uniref:Membrane insertase YidC/Oxa/ALB C-terminal domain-containing protein n=2 Tax=Agaricus bisporus var. burnettii TaxID=192524 RepID=A0A8H7EUI4_AGABI|nr:hypothetical protein Agabi119p4_11351 [Agaricus bisporus var. burnettii]
MGSILFGNTVRLLGRRHLGCSRGFVPRYASSMSSPSESMLHRGFASVRPQNVLGLSYSASGSVLQSRRVLPTLLLTRHYSKDSPTPVVSEATATTTEAVEAASSAPVPPIDVASSITDSASSLADTTASTLEAIHTPLQYGDLSALGLASWTPAGVVQWSMEIINTTTHLPWFWTIIAGSIFWRLVVLPFSLLGLRNTSRLQPYQDHIARLQAQMKDAAARGDPILRQKTTLKLKEIYQNAGVSMFGGILMPFIQIPVTFGMFIGIKNMCNLPVEQMKWSGLEWLPDLTMADPTWFLPILTCALVNIQIPLGVAEMDLKTRPAMGHIMNALRVLTVVSIPVTGYLPSGLVLALVTTSTFTIFQTVALRYKPLRRLLGIQNMPTGSKLPTLKESWDYAIKAYDERRKEALHIERSLFRRLRKNPLS